MAHIKNRHVLLENNKIKVLMKAAKTVNNR